MKVLQLGSCIGLPFCAANLISPEVAHGPAGAGCELDVI